MKELIKFAGHQDDLVWVYPKTKIHRDALVLVDKEHQAIMVREGEADIPYFPGENKVFNDVKFSIFSSNKYIDNCHIYFFNKSRNVKKREWGTRYPIRYFDKRYKIELSIRAHGTYKIYLDNPRLFLNNFYNANQSNLMIENTIKDIVITKLTEVISKILILKNFDLLSINAFLDEITRNALEAINTDLEQFGFSIFDLVILQLLPLEEEQLNKLKEKELNNVLERKEELHCPKCDEVVNQKMKFCANCGEKLFVVEDGEENVF